MSEEAGKPLNVMWSVPEEKYVKDRMIALFSELEKEVREMKKETLPLTQDITNGMIALGENNWNRKGYNTCLDEVLSLISSKKEKLQ